MSLGVDLVEYLAGKGLQVYKAAGPEITIHCIFCVDGDPKGKGKLYCNTEEGLFHCKRCLAAGNLRQLLAHYGDEPAAEELPGTDPAARRRVLADAAAYATDCLTANDQMLVYLLEERGLAPETIMERRLGWLPPRWSLKEHLQAKGHHVADIRAAGLLHREGPRADQDFFGDQLVIPYTSRGQVLALRAKQLGGRYYTGPGEAVRLYDVDELGEATEAVICEGEFDTMALKQALAHAPDDRVRKIGVVGLPGASALPSGFEQYFAHTRRVYLGFDPDEAGRRAAVKVKDLLGAKARILELPDGLPKCDWSQYFSGRHKGWRDAVELLGQASGKRLWTVSEAFTRWRRQRSEGTGLGLGFAGYDHVTQPGLLPGHVMVILAKTGTGKTVTLSNLAYNLRSTPTLYLSLELTQEQVLEQLWRIHHFHQPYADHETFEREFATLRICEQNRMAEREVGELIDEYIEDVGQPPGLVLLDYLGYFARGARGGSPYEKTSNAVMALKAIAKDRRVPIIAPHQVNRVAKEGKPISIDDARDSGVVEETADFLLSIYRPDDAIDDANLGEAMPTGKVRLAINKSRSGGKGRVFTLQFSLASLALVDADSDLATKAEHENKLIWEGYTYEQIRAQTPVRQLQLVRGG